MDLLNIMEVSQRIRLSQTSIRRLLKEGRFPVSRSLLGRRKYWLAGDIDDWLANQIRIPGDLVEEKSGNWLSRWS